MLKIDFNVSISFGKDLRPLQPHPQIVMGRIPGVASLPFLFKSPLFSALAHFYHSTLSHCLSNIVLSNTGIYIFLNITLFLIILALLAKFSVDNVSPKHLQKRNKNILPLVKALINPKEIFKKISSKLPQAYLFPVHAATN